MLRVMVRGGWILRYVDGDHPVVSFGRPVAVVHGFSVDVLDDVK